MIYSRTYANVHFQCAKLGKVRCVFRDFCDWEKQEKNGQYFYACVELCQGSFYSKTKNSRLIGKLFGTDLVVVKFQSGSVKFERFEHRSSLKLQKLCIYIRLLDYTVDETLEYTLVNFRYFHLDIFVAFSTKRLRVIYLNILV